MAKKKAAEKPAAPAETIESFKGFDSNMQCRGYTLNDAGEFEAVK